MQEITDNFHTFFHFLTACGAPTLSQFFSFANFTYEYNELTMAYVQLMSNFITCLSSVIVKQLCHILHSLMSRRTQSPSAHVLVANSSSSVVEFSYPSFEELYASRRSDSTSLNAF